ncbi:hypothetical protein COE25_10095 [Bacillus sp. AFS031507]|nr:hypothetical protein COE25_10095 [Bacillus sp. AFS031507]
MKDISELDHFISGKPTFISGNPTFISETSILSANESSKLQSKNPLLSYINLKFERISHGGLV